MDERLPFHVKTAIKPKLKRRSVSTYRIWQTESLTWDDVCQLWDSDVITAEDIKNIAPLYFEKAELTAVLEVIEKVENDSYTDCDTPLVIDKPYFERGSRGLH